MPQWASKNIFFFYILAPDRSLAHTSDNYLFFYFCQVFIVKGKFNTELIFNFKCCYIQTGKRQAGYWNIQDVKHPAAVILRMVDIGPTQICFFANPVAEFEFDRKNPIATAFNLKLVFIAFKRIRLDNFLEAAMRTD